MSTNDDDDDKDKGYSESTKKLVKSQLESVMPASSKRRTGYTNYYTPKPYTAPAKTPSYYSSGVGYGSGSGYPYADPLDTLYEEIEGLTSMIGVYQRAITTMEITIEANGNNSLSEEQFDKVLELMRIEFVTLQEEIDHAH